MRASVQVDAIPDDPVAGQLVTRPVGTAPHPVGPTAYSIGLQICAAAQSASLRTLHASVGSSHRTVQL
ncbi:MAG: hypothetical protein FD127_4511 [Acidimicrobiaceae bacterium]|nr:MAG: hypothetical protein FD127_4511 [Acidimicrobiaceae bacterium]